MKIERRRYKRISVLMRRKIHSLRAGIYHGYVGQNGFDLRTIREYRPGDPVKCIHWGVTAKTGKPMVRETEPEIAMDMALVLDLSPSMFYGTDEVQKVEVAYDISAAVAYLGSRDGNHVGVVIAKSEATSIKPGQGYRHWGNILGLVTESQTQDGTPSAFSEALLQSAGRYKRRGLAVVISDFLRDDWADELERLTGRHDVLAVRVIDKIERKLEDVGVIPFEDPMTGEFDWYDTSDKDLRDAYEVTMDDERKDIRDRIIGSGAEYFELDTHGDQLEEFIQLLNRRNRLLARGRRAA